MAGEKNDQAKMLSLTKTLNFHNIQLVLAAGTQKCGFISLSWNCCFGTQPKNTFVSGETEAFADMQDNELLVVHLVAVDVICFMS